jgi:hypothetical protein
MLRQLDSYREKPLYLTHGTGQLGLSSAMAVEYHFSDAKLAGF